MAFASNLSVVPSRSRRLTPITESPPDSPDALESSLPASRRLSLRSLHKTLQRRTRTTSATSSTSTREMAAAENPVWHVPRKPAPVADAATPDDTAQSALPRNSGTFGPVDISPTGDEPGLVQLSPTHEISSVPALSPSSVGSPVDGFFADDVPSRLSGTFGPPPASQDTSELPPAGPNFACRLPLTEAEASQPSSLGLPVVALPKLKASPSAASLFYTPTGSTVSLRLRDVGGELVENIAPETPHDTAEDGGWPPAEPLQPLQANSPAPASHSPDRRISLDLLTTHTALVALAQKLSDEAAALEHTRAGLDSVRRSLDIELEGLIGRFPLAQSEPNGSARPSRHSVGPTPVTTSDCSPLSFAKDALTTTSAVSSNGPPSWSTVSPARSTPGLQMKSMPVDDQPPTLAWLGQSAEGTLLASQASLPVRIEAPSAEARLGRRERRQSWIRRLFA